MDKLNMGEVLPPLPVWQARSFWLTLLALISMLAPALGLDAGWAADPATIDWIMQVVGAIAVALAWRERMAPNFRLSWWGS